MKNIKFLFLGLVSILLLSCGSDAGTTIKGEIADASNMTAYFDKTDANNIAQPLGKTDTDANGSFKFNFPEGLDGGTYRVRIGAKAAELVLLGTEKEIVLGGSLADFSQFKYNIEGSEFSKEYNSILNRYYSKELPVKDLQKMLISDLDPLVAMPIAIKVFKNSPTYAEIHSAICTRLSEKYPELDCTKTYEQLVAQLKATAARSSGKQYNVKVGDMAPEIAMPNPAGKVYKLSDLKGKVVLLDFWASWCGPCRRANPHVVETYKKYKDQGFVVFNVSLDGLDTRTKSRLPDAAAIDKKMKDSKKRWMDAIVKDNLNWDYHVSDLKKWESSAAREYGVKSIPTTFLIDRDGKIASLNPRNNLEAELLKFL